MNEILSTENLTIGYSQNGNKTILHERIEVALHPGELVCLIGPNGSGKSTLLKTLAGIQPSLKGQVILYNQKIGAYNVKELARTVGIVLTDRNFGGIRVFDFVSLGRYPYTGFFAHLTNEDYRIVFNVLQVTGLTSFKKKHFNKLSDGEKQKVMIARVLAQQTPLILLDEPTAFLDLPAKYEIFKLLSSLAYEQKKAIILTTHDLELALKFADKIWLLEHDKEFLFGAPEDLVINNVFDNFFTASNFHFNPNTGTFDSIVKDFKPIKLTGKGIETFWMVRALHRKGYSVTHDLCNIEVNIETKNQYSISAYGKKIEVTSIENLLIELENINSTK
jgi:iron complex transport system ATP-binding protein